MPPELEAAEIESLRLAHYNAAVSSMERMHENLFIVRVKPDGGFPPFAAGRYTSLGMGYWEPRQEPCEEEALLEGQERRLAKRAYSVGSPIVAPGERRLIEPAEEDFLEFFVAVVRFGSPGDDEAPALTTRLVLLEAGDRLWIGPKFAGVYGLDRARQGQDFLFCATGTGEAPHNRMVWQLLREGRGRRIVNITCARTRGDLAYHEVHAELMRKYPRYLYHPMTTRDQSGAKLYIQDLIESGKLEAILEARLDPESWDVFLCGNPAMIGAPKTTQGAKTYPEPRGLVEVLETRFGFQADARGARGNVHFETYW